MRSINIGEIPELSEVLTQFTFRGKQFTYPAIIINLSVVSNLVKYGVKPVILGHLDEVTSINILYMHQSGRYLSFHITKFETAGSASLVIYSNEKGSFIERRAYPRFEYLATGRLCPFYKEIWDDCTLVDISRYGIQIKTQTKLSIDQKLHIIFYDHILHKSVEVEARVVHMQDFSIVRAYGLSISNSVDVCEICRLLQEKEAVELLKDC